MIAVDLDEAAHGAYACSKYLGDVFAGKPERVAGEIRDDAALLASAPKEALIREAVPHGVGDFSAAVGASAAVLPLAGLAIHAGIHEIRDARGQLRDCAGRERRLRDALRVAEALTPVVPETANEAALLRQARKDNGFSRRLALKDLGIGISSALSGAAIALKSSLDIGFKSALAAVQKKFSLLDAAQQGTQIGTAGMVAGAAGTLVLSPLAGLFATTLGISFVRKSASKHRQLKRDVALARQDLQINLALLDASGKEEPRHVRYAEFIRRQADKRIQFFRGFRRWNKAFLLGSGLYAASATTKMAVTAAALAGVGAAASNPVGLGVLLGLGVLGALIMGGASLSFLTGHDRQGRFSRHTGQDHPDVDREFLASLDLYRKPAPEGSPTSDAGLRWSVSGLDTRARCLEALDARKEALRTLLRGAADANGKLPPGDPAHHVWSKLACGLRTGTQFLHTLVTKGDAARARIDARATRLAHRRDLGSGQLDAWLGTPQGHEALLGFVEADLRARAGYLSHKLAVRLDIQERTGIEMPADADDAAKSRLQDLIAFLSEQDGLIERDQAELERCRALLAQADRCRTPFDGAENPDAAAERARFLGNLCEYFGVLSEPEPEAGQGGSSRLLSRTLARDLGRDVKNARGVSTLR